MYLVKIEHLLNGCHQLRYVSACACSPARFVAQRVYLIRDEEKPLLQIFIFAHARQRLGARENLGQFFSPLFGLGLERLPLSLFLLDHLAIYLTHVKLELWQVEQQVEDFVRIVLKVFDDLITDGLEVFLCLGKRRKLTRVQYGPL